MEKSMNIQIERVNTEVEEEIKEKNCFNCEFIKLNPQGKMFCHRRENEGVVFEIVDIYTAHLPCPAKDVEVWDEYIDENGDFIKDNELGYGYQAYLINKGV